MYAHFKGGFDLPKRLRESGACPRAFLMVPAQDYVGRFIATFRDFPPRQKPPKFNVDDVMRNMQEGATH